MKKDKICKCGHPKFKHVRQYFGTDDSCMGIIQRDDMFHTVYWCQCSHFRLDNLSYLEQCYEQKTSKG